MTSIRTFICALAAAASFLTASAAYAGSCDVMDPNKMATAPATDKAAYPLDTCVVSGDKLDGGDMGGPIDFVYKQEGKPDRLVRFCCKNCIKKFKADPIKYLKMIDEAAAGKAKADSGHLDPMH